jgi:hypothetical protein
VQRCFFESVSCLRRRVSLLHRRQRPRPLPWVPWSGVVWRAPKQATKRSRLAAGRVPSAPLPTELTWRDEGNEEAATEAAYCKEIPAYGDHHGGDKLLGVRRAFTIALRPRFGMVRCHRKGRRGMPRHSPALPISAVPIGVTERGTIRRIGRLV